MLQNKSRKIMTLLMILLAVVAVLALTLTVYLQSLYSSSPKLSQAAAALGEEYSRQWANDKIKAENAALRRQQQELQHDRTEYFNELHVEKIKSLIMLVNPWNPLPEGYEPELYTVSNRAYTEEDHYVDVRCAESLDRMLTDCVSSGCYALICSSYRTQDYQAMLYYNKVERLLNEGVDYNSVYDIAAQSVAIPGTSEHQLGLAVDVIDGYYPELTQWQEYTQTQQWLMENSWKYGFTLRYPNGTTDITGIIYEPWHYRYVGYFVAQELYKSGITLEEYLGRAEH